MTYDEFWEKMKNKDEQHKVFFTAIEHEDEIMNEIVKMRKQNMLTQEEVAKKCNRSPLEIIDVEKEVENPDLDFIIDMAQAVGGELMALMPEEKQFLLDCRG